MFRCNPAVGSSVGIDHNQWYPVVDIQLYSVAVGNHLQLLPVVVAGSYHNSDTIVADSLVVGSYFVVRLAVGSYSVVQKLVVGIHHFHQMTCDLHHSRSGYHLYNPHLHCCYFCYNYLHCCSCCSPHRRPYNPHLTPCNLHHLKTCLHFCSDFELKKCRDKRLD